MKDKDFVLRAKSSRNESSWDYQLCKCVALGGLSDVISSDLF